MRTIKFRTWDEDHKCMTHVGCINFWGDGGIKEVSPGDERKVMQYTGLKDKNNKEIYEGDILEYYYNSDIEHKKGKGNTFRVEVVYRIGIEKHGYEEYRSHHVGFMTKWLEEQGSEEMQYSDLPEPNMCRIKVIGNIYENPELLNNGNNK